MTIAESFINLIAPYRCIGCDREGQILCDWCAPALDEQIPSRCFRCHRLSKDSLVCGTCRPVVHLKHVWVATEYRGLAKQLVQACKYERAKAAVEPIAAQMAQTLPYLPDYIVVHVPTASSRRRQRGYDQAELIAKKLALQLKLSRSESLMRFGHTRQVGSSRKERLKQLENAFVVRSPVTIKGKNILLVDDIVTTGATLTTAAQILKKNGARSVSAVVFAQRM